MYKKRISQINGIIIFLISLTVYLLTIEPTNSFWDCSEFITCAYKLEVGHAPGAPLFMLLGRFFSLLSAGDNTKVAIMINGLSAIASALTIMFLYWTLLYFVEKLIDSSNNEKMYKNKLLIIHGAAIIGALAYAFTDSFWFSAVEGEVYATSSLFSAIVFWAILRWDRSDETHSNRWIILIFYLLGLSVGIHLLNVLAIPAMALIVYYKKFKYSVQGMILTLILSFIILVLFIFGIIPGVAKLTAYMDLLFVNSFNLPVYSGAITAIIIIIVTLRLGYKYTLQKQQKLLNLAIFSFSFWLIGYSSFSILVIRSNANPFVDINNVENIFGLVNYLNREQYPKRPLFYGNNYNSPVVDITKRYTYKLINGKYIKDEMNPKYKFDKNTITFFPRMASLEAKHADPYQKWINIKGRKVKVRNRNGTTEIIKVPTFGDNLRFFFKYQVGHMYFRYFMWNFAGRQNDIQGFGSNLEGNWISGIPFFDNMRLGDQQKLPPPFKNEKTNNRYFLIPLLVGLFGLYYQYNKDRKRFWVILSLFIFSGIAIVVYLNEVPVTPRERDYVYVGSFYAFAIWIGLGVTALINQLKSINKNTILTAGVLGLIFFLVVGNLLIQNFDDHNRSNRFTARDFAKNTLLSCRENAILFTTADNDTYPIWYLQEVEGFRTDIREILTTFLPVDWYADQLNIHYNTNGRIPISFKGEELLQGKNQYFPLISKIDSAIDLAEAIKFVKSNDPRTKVRSTNNETIDYIPGKTFSLKVNKINFLSNFPDSSLNPNLIPNEIVFKINKNHLQRDDLLILDILTNNDWKRPVYFMYPETIQKLGLGDYLYREGGVYRLLPFKNGLPLNIMYPYCLQQYQLVMQYFTWGNVNHPDVFLDYHNIRMIESSRYKQMFAELAQMLIQCNEKEKALELLNLEQKLFPSNRVPYSLADPTLVDSYYSADANIEGDTLTQEISEYIVHKLEYYTENYINQKNVNQYEINHDLYILHQLVEITGHFKRKINSDLSTLFNNHYKKFIDPE